MLTPAQPDFLRGSGLPEAWAGQPQWRVLETGFGLGLHFLVTWLAWKNDPQRPRLLHFVAADACPASSAELLRMAAKHPELSALAVQLGEQWHGLLPGFHRLVFEGGHVLLTLCIGEVKVLLKEQSFEADSVYLAGVNWLQAPDICDPHLLTAVARCCRRGTRLASMMASKSVVDGLTQCGFEVSETTPMAPQGELLQASFNPRWEPKKSSAFNLPKPRSPARCIVLGAGLAGAACAASLARRGWQVTVLDAHAAAAGGASALPVGLLAPHVSPDDSMLSRLSRSGLRATWQVAKSQLEAAVDWQASGVLQRRFDTSAGLPKHWPEAGEHWSRLAGPDERQAVKAASSSADTGSENVTPALWHAAGGWIKPQRLVHALLATPGVNARYGVKIASLKRSSSAHPDGCWQVFDADGKAIAEAELLVLAAGFESAGLASTHAHLRLQAVRGQVTWGEVNDARALPPFPVNGHGSFIPAFLNDAGQPSWLMGATFERDNFRADVKVTDQLDIFGRLQQLLPHTAGALKASFDADLTRAWAGVRCVSPDRLPIVGPLDDAALPGLHACTALGSRGLSFAVLCGELLAAGLHAEPLPIEKRLAQSLLASRYHIAE
ncbi:MAG: FAD-dependent 5-carboxymethylaminomethyl-2-thiouridine(34) oxidoreductase MnmC [Polaromonas sp.]|nr:FAD-dependent 5-carboxymethylaminomethyl-2-thiouridine(34) oxidoreductase MnmC [Polaromonas sp.]